MVQRPPGRNTKREKGTMKRLICPLSLAPLPAVSGAEKGTQLPTVRGIPIGPASGSGTIQAVGTAPATVRSSRESANPRSARRRGSEPSGAIR